MAYTKNATVDSWDTAKQLEYYKANPTEAQQEIARANSVGGSAASNWASQLQSNLPPTPQQASQGSSYSSAPVYAPPAPSYSGPSNVIGNVGNSSNTSQSYQSIYDNYRASNPGVNQINSWSDKTGNVYNTTSMTPQQTYALMLNKDGNQNSNAILSGMGLDINGNPVYAPPATSYTKNAAVDAMPIDQQLAYYKAHPQEAQQEISRAQGVGGSAAQNWVNQLKGVVPQGSSQSGSNPVQASNSGATQLAGGGWAPASTANVEAEAARKYALALQEKTTIANQQKAGLTTTFNRLRQSVGEDRALENISNQRNLSPFSGRSDYALGMIARERAKADQQQQEDYATRSANIDATLANYANASAEERQRMVDELVRADRDFNYKVSRDQSSDAAAKAKSIADAEQQEIENAFKVGDRTGYLQLPQVTKAMNEITNNSNAWFNATPDEKKRLAARNQQLGASIGAWQNENGDWMPPDPVPTLAREKQEYDQVYTKYRDDIKDQQYWAKFDNDNKQWGLEFAVDQAYKQGQLSIQARNAALSEAREARLASDDEGKTSKINAKESADNYNLLLDDINTEGATKEQLMKLAQANRDYLSDSDYSKLLAEIQKKF